MTDEMKNLRQFIKYFLLENKKDILGEPDLSSETERENKKDRDEFFRSMIPKGGNGGHPKIKLGLSMPSFSGKKEKTNTNKATAEEDEKDIDEINTVASVGLSAPMTPIGSDSNKMKKKYNPYDPERPY